MKKVRKFFFYLDYLWFRLVLSKIPYGPGENLRYNYFRSKMSGNIGSNVAIGEDTYLGSYKLVHIGNNIRIANQVTVGYEVGGEIDIKNGTLIGQGTIIVNNMHEYRMKNIPPAEQGYIMPFKKTVIGENVWIGARVIIMPGVEIGNNSVIGAGAVVTKDIGSGVIAVGIPAQAIKDIQYLN